MDDPILYLVVEIIYIDIKITFPYTFQLTFTCSNSVKETPEQ